MAERECSPGTLSMACQPFNKMSELRTEDNTMYSRFHILK